jgi:hypothetical protein
MDLATRLERIRYLQSNLHGTLQQPKAEELPAEMDAAVQMYFDAWIARGWPASEFPWPAGARPKVLPLPNRANTYPRVIDNEDKIRLQALQDGLHGFVEDLKRTQRDKAGLSVENRKLADEIWRLREENHLLKLQGLERAEAQKRLERWVRSAQHWLSVSSTFAILGTRRELS